MLLNSMNEWMNVSWRPKIKQEKVYKLEENQRKNKKKEFEERKRNLKSFKNIFQVKGMGFSRKKLKPPCWGYQWKFPGGVYQNMREKKRISRGVNAKKVENSRGGGHHKIDWKSREVNFKNIDILNSRVYNFFLEKPIMTIEIIKHKL